MQTRSSDENSVRPSVRLSVRLSVRHTRALLQNGRKVCPDLYTIRKIILPVGKPSATGQPTRPTQLFIPPGSINE